jgi:regulation of enolase protein 1 (concanavalin A-like superfamily)
MRTWSVVCTHVLAMVLGAVPASDAATIYIGAGGNLQAALDTAQPGDTILLEPGALYLGSFVIRRAVTVQTNGPLPAGRVTPEWSGRLAILRSTTSEPALRTAPNVSGVHIIGLEIAPNGSTGGTSILIGSGTETDDTRQPTHVMLDRLLVRGHAISGQKRGIALHGSHITVTRSYIADIKLKDQDTQAIWINNGWGPYTITDNYLEASGENLMTGGDRVRIPQLVPADIVIVGNTFMKPLVWQSQGWAAKNLLEFKNARRVVVRDNLFDGNWVSAQSGYALLVSPRNQYGSDPWTVTEDILFERNVIRNVSSAFNVTGDDDKHPSLRTNRITIRQNLIVPNRAAFGGAGRCMQVGRSPQQLVYEHNTCISDGSAFIYTYRGGDVRVTLGGVFRSNVFVHNQYGFSGDGATSGGVQALAPHYPDLVFTDNLIGGGVAANYPNNLVLSASEFQAHFVNYAHGDFRLTDAARARFASHDGAAIGMDVPALAAGAPSTSTSPTAPALWSTGDIGAVSPAGSTTNGGGMFLMAGSGADIWGSADAFHFSYRTLAGDGSITARVTTLEAVHAWTKAGVMMRETLDPRSKHAMMIVSPAKGLAFQRRVTTGNVSTHTSGGAGAAPYWVRLVRSGHTFTAFVSMDGTVWSMVGAETIPMASTIYVGLPVTSHTNGTLARTTIDSVDVTGAER